MFCTAGVASPRDSIARSSHSSGQNGQVQSRVIDAAGTWAAPEGVVVDGSVGERCMGRHLASSMPMRWTAQRKRRPPALRLPMQALVSWIAATGETRPRAEGSRPCHRGPRKSDAAHRLCVVLEQSVTRGSLKLDKPCRLFTATPRSPIGMELVLLAYVDAASGMPTRPSCSAEATSHALAPVRAAASMSSRWRIPPAPITSVWAGAVARTRSKVARSGPS